MVTGCRLHSSLTARISLFRLVEGGVGQLLIRKVRRHNKVQLSKAEFNLSVPSYLAQCQFNVRKLLLESLIHVLLQV